MHSNPPATWLLPVRNGMPYLLHTLASIANQTYRNHKIIAWDNGSSDGTLLALRQWIPDRIPGVVIHDRPLRLGASLAAMVEMADTEFCAIIHGDDINHPWRLERQIEFLNQHPAVGVLGGQSDFIDEQDQSISGWSFACDDATIRWRSRWMAHLMHSTVLFRKNIILKAGNYRDCQPYEDMELWIRTSHVTEFANLPETLIQYRRSSTSLTGRTADFQSIFREGARLNAAILFPGVPAAEAMRLWEASYASNEPAPVRLRDFRSLHRAAVQLARQCGKPDHYFTSTSFFSEQRYHMRRRWLQQHRLNLLVRT
jgi:glycosyltransferase involved in cell wall biosynthesis